MPNAIKFMFWLKGSISLGMTKQEMQIIVETILTSLKKDGEDMSKKIQYIPSRLFHSYLIHEKCCSQITSLLFSKNVDLHLISICFPCQCAL